MWDTFFTGPAVWFAVPALLGTGVFVLKVILMSLGAAEFDFDGGDAISEALADADAASDSVFKYLSVQTVAAFAMGGGWAGLTALRTLDWPLAAAIAAAAAGGFGVAYLLAKGMALILKLQASGNISVHAAVDREGDVTLGVPGRRAGRGTVRVVIDDRQREYPAVTDAPDGVATGQRVLVIAVNDDRTLTVAAL